MAFSITKHNKGNNQYSFKAGTDFEYKKLSELAHAGAVVRGFFINKKSKYGAHPVAVCDSFYVDLPKYSMDQINEIIADSEATEAINNGKVGIAPDPYTTSDGKEFIGFTLFDIE